MVIEKTFNKIKEQLQGSRVKIIAVTKYADEEEIYKAYNLGINDFGESYVQNTLDKISKINAKYNLKNKINWHFIGRLQKNKAKFVIGEFCLIHSVDSIELVELINRLSGERKLIQDILIQVNISGEASKAGFKESDLKNVFGKLLKLANIKILGLMTIAPDTSNTEVVRDCFLKLKTLKDELNKTYNSSLTELSMGMSNDYMIAVESGATVIRLGKVLFKD